MTRLLRLAAMTVLGAMIAGSLGARPVLGATTWVVNSAADSGGACTLASCTLRAAILAANASVGGDVITFMIGAGQKTILVGAGAINPLPTISGSDIVVDGSTQPSGGPRGIRLHDPDVGGHESGLVISGDRVTIRGLIITKFDSYGIYLPKSAREAVIQGNWIGTANGTADESQVSDGIRIQGGGPAVNGGGHLVGGDEPAERNLISGSNADGIEIEDSSDNVVSGNFVGMTANGLSRLPNAGSGVRIVGLSYRNRIGGLTTGERNIISGNQAFGVDIAGQMVTDGTCKSPRDNVVQGNYIGLAVDGSTPTQTGITPRGNLLDNVILRRCAQKNVIGGSTAGARNVIGASRQDGVEIDSLGGPTDPALRSCHNVVIGNYIGTDPTGMAARPNYDDGAAVDDGSCSNRIGGSTAAERNIISGNFNDGVEISHNGSTSNVVRRNWIGLAADGTTALGNSQNGVLVRSQARSNRIESNVIAANGGNGVLLSGRRTSLNLLTFNWIGTTSAGNSSRGNAGYGIHLLDGPQSNSIVGNLVRASGNDAIAVEENPATNADLLDRTYLNKISRNRTLFNAGLGIDLLPVDGVNANDGAFSLDQGNRGTDHPVITAATSISAKGTAPSGTTVEVFTATPGAGETHGEGSTYRGMVTAAGNGTWCLAGLSLSGQVTATATASGGNTSEFGPNVAVTGTADLCAAPTSFSDDFTAADGSAPDATKWDVRKSAAGPDAGASIQDNELRFAVNLSAEQNGTWQFVQARVKSFQPSWASQTVSFQWQMDTDATATQNTGMVITPSATIGSATSQPDYFRVRLVNGGLSLVRRSSAGTPDTIWGPEPITMTDGLSSFELRLDDSTVRLLVNGDDKTGAILHGLTFTSGHAYLYAITNSTASFAPHYDTVVIEPL